MQEEEFSNNEGWHTVMRSLFLQLVTFLSRSYSTQRSLKVSPLTRLASVVVHIQKRFREQLRIEELARLAHLSPSQFHRTFRRCYNTTVVQFTTQLRIHEACELLKDPAYDVTRAAMECGFNSPAFFSTRFKEFMGESPSAYRRRVLPDISL
jgi:AraC-like DNA-binding protein